MNDHNKHILYIRTDIGSEHLQAGGSVAHTLGVIRGFIDNGYRITIASSATYAVLEQEWRLHRLTLPQWIRVLGIKMSSLIANIWFYRTLYYLVTTTKPDHLYHRYSVLSCVVPYLAQKYTIPLILEFNGSEVWVDEYWTRKKILRLRWLLQWCERYTLRNAYRIIAVSQALANQLISQGISAEKIIIAPNGVDTNIFCAGNLHAQRITIREKYAILPTETIIGFIGTFSEWHGTNILADVITQLLPQYPNLYFMLIGDGPRMSTIQHALSRSNYANRVILTGTITQQYAPHYLAACDLYICPTQPNNDGSPFFGSPTKLFEYMSMGKPIIASRLGQIGDILQPAVMIDTTHNKITNEIAILVEQVTNAHSFARAIEYGMSLGQEREQLGNNARNTAIKYHSWQQHVKKIMNHEKSA